MAIIPQTTMFCWEDDIEVLGDLERLKLLLETLPDEDLVRSLEKRRGKGRDDFPIRTMWNAFLAAFVLQHPTIASFRRELLRNVQLRYLCGIYHLDKVPKAYNFSRFMGLLMKYLDEVEQLIPQLAERMTEEIPDFGNRLAMDSKFIDSRAKRRSGRTSPDRRSESDADWGKKTYQGVHRDGKAWKKEVSCFGFKVHLVTDSTYELPVDFILSRASESDVAYGHKVVDKLQAKHRKIVDRCEYMTADKAYDDGKLISRLMKEEINIRPVIDKRRLWKDELERELPGHANLYYNEYGEVFCYDLKNGTRRTLVNDGYEKSRKCIRKKCPARAYGVRCPSLHECPVKGVVRIPLSTDVRIFTAVDRSSLKWKREYKYRSSVERVFSRMDVSLGFELHSLRGFKRMRLQCATGLIVMLGMALGRVQGKKPELMRSLVRSA